MRTKAGFLFCIIALLISVGCRTSTTFLRPDQQTTIDRSVVDYPPNFDLKEYARNLNCPSGFCFDPDGTMFVVEGGIDNQPIHIFGQRKDGSIIEIYPRGVHVPLVDKSSFKIHGPVGGIAAGNGKLFVSHRDANDMGVITAFNYDGTHSTVVSEFPAQGEYGITDIAIHPGDGRLFGVGPATNSGIVGLDDWQIGWLKKHPEACDYSPVDLKLYGLKFTSSNPFAGFFGAGDTAVTAPFQKFNTNDNTHISKADNGRADSCVYSVSQSGGDLTLECFGIRLPRGIAFPESGGRAFVTNDGMEMRGTRPIQGDGDALIKILSDAWFGFPDYSVDLVPATEARFQPPASLMTHGFHEQNLLIDRDSSHLLPIGQLKEQIYGVFPPMSGAAKLDFIPGESMIAPYGKFRGQAIVALSGDRAPFATSGLPLPNGPVGYKIVSVNVENKKVADFIYNVRGLPASRLGHGVVALERPVDVKLAPDGSLYVLDMGAFTDNDGKIHVTPRTGRIFKLVPIIEPERPKS